MIRWFCGLLTLDATNTDNGSATANIQGDRFEGASFTDLQVSGDAERKAVVDLNFDSNAKSTANDATHQHDGHLGKTILSRPR